MQCGPIRDSKVFDSFAESIRFENRSSIRSVHRSSVVFLTYIIRHILFNSFTHVFKLLMVTAVQGRTKGCINGFIYTPKLNLTTDAEYVANLINVNLWL